MNNTWIHKNISKIAKIYIKIRDVLKSLISKLLVDENISKEIYPKIATNNNLIIPLAPVITEVTFKTTDSITLTFTQETNGATITNYKYSIDDGETYRECTPVVIDSPVTISGLTNGRSYAIRLRAVNANGDGVESGTLVATLSI